MKRYYKDIEGLRVWYNGAIRKEDKVIYTWDDSLILADGWTEYIPQPYIPTLEDIIAQKVAEIDAYDSSEAINEFFIGNNALWLDKATRVGLMLRFQAEESQGKNTTSLWHLSDCFTLPISVAKQMLNVIEVYASECYDNTARHKANVEALETIEAVREYDYTTGYPEKLTFQWEQ